MEDLELEVKKLIVDVLLLDDVEPADIDTDAPLLVEGLGLDSIDALELAMAISKRYAIKFRPDEQRNRVAFGSVRALAAYIEENRAARSP
jgi:acyl carrier protein